MDSNRDYKKTIMLAYNYGAGRGSGKSDLFNQTLKEWAEDNGVDVVYVSAEDMPDMEEMENRLALTISEEDYLPKIKVPSKQKNPPRSYGNIGKGKQRRW